MNDNSKIIAAILAGAVVGVAVGYFIASGDKEKAMENIEGTITDIKDTLLTHIEKGRMMVNHVADKADELLNTKESKA